MKRKLIEVGDGNLVDPTRVAFVKALKDHPDGDDVVHKIVVVLDSGRAVDCDFDSPRELDRELDRLKTAVAEYSA